MPLDTMQKKGWEAPPGPAVLPCAWHPGKTVASQGRQLMAGSGEGYANGFTATAVLGSGSDASGEEKPLKLKPNRLSKVMHIGRKPHSDIRFGNMAVSWQHMTVTLHRGSVSKGHKPKVTVKDLSTLGSAFKAAGKKRWARLDKDTETEVKSGTRFALPCKVTQKAKPAKAGEKQQSLHSCFALYFLEDAPKGGWPAPILSDEEVAELAALGRGEQVADSPTAAAEASDKDASKEEAKKTDVASESKGKEAKAKKKTSEAPEEETPVPTAGPKDKAGSKKKKKKEESSASEKPDEKAEAGDSEDEGQDEEQPKLASESDGEKPDKDGEDEEDAAVEVKADSDSEEKEEAEAKADSDSEEKEEAEAKADSDSEEKEEAEAKADSDSEEKEEAEAKADSDSEEKEEAEAKADSDSEEKEEEAEAKADDSDSEEKAEAEDAKEDSDSEEKPAAQEDSDSEEQQKKESESSAEESPVARKKSDSESEKHARKKRRANRRKDSSEGSSSAQKITNRAFVECIQYPTSLIVCLAMEQETMPVPSSTVEASAPKAPEAQPAEEGLSKPSDVTVEESEDDRIDEIPLWLHVYDLNETTGYLNNYGLKNASLGLFHAGVEVLGTEYFFGWGDTELSGIRCNRPRQHAVHAYRESVFMGMTSLSEEQVEEAIDSAFEQWPEINYHPIHRNCTLFAEEFLRSLKAPEPFPEWVHGAAALGRNEYLRPVVDWSWEWAKWSLPKVTFLLGVDVSRGGPGPGGAGNVSSNALHFTQAVTEAPPDLRGVSDRGDLLREPSFDLMSSNRTGCSFGEVGEGTLT
ncbi:hypothetical protein AK812_SmicGene20419 [Symbiodinium microadriaticum]|uniref:PPPDE domain-containing protein n=1 Tax=Symbiodinium microadriaticum TaxID=2951 RepID=A0A1Q9DQ16_SYMMI|nr:hypothetical protein AK812_SmicGene20419 [Symbiodinium microadriaticum]